MANATADYGFVPLYSLVGEIRQIECAALTAASDLYVGDPVKLSGTGDSSGRPSVTVAAAGDATIFGVVVGIVASGPDNLNKQYSNSADTVMVVPALAATVFRVNASNTTGASLNDIGLTFDHVATAGDTQTGRSKYALDMGEDATAGATTANQWRLIGFDRRSDNEFSTTVSTDTANVDLLVTCVESVWNGQAATGGDGV